MRTARKQWLFGMLFGCWLLPAAAEELRFNTQDFPPFSYLVDGKVTGPAVEVARAVCDEIKVTCSFKSLPWTRAQVEVEQGEADGLFVIRWSAEREKQLWFSPPVMTSAYGVFVHADDALQYAKALDLAGYTVGVYGPSATSRALEQIRDLVGREGGKPITIEMRPDDESGFHKLSAKRVQAVFSNQEVGTAMLGKLGIKNIRYAGSAENFKYYIGLSRKTVDKVLVDRFNKGFRKLHLEGTITKILAAHHMREVPQKSWDEK